MNRLANRALSAVLALVLLCSAFISVSAKPASEQIITAPTGYTKASDVEYQTLNGYTLNWGARGEVCVFLSPNALAFYTGTTSYDALSSLEGSKQQNQVPGSSLFGALQELMESQHTFFTKYNKKGDGDSRQLYIYTDCMLSDSSQISTLYRGDIKPSAWSSGKTYNQEHVWPQSKCQNDKEVGDIMHLRACNPSENSSRGNDSYGESAGYYDPGVSVRGDCARMVLYMYVRWGNTSKMWGSGGVMESVDILLKWMEEDPVDTWEMGRNDAVQSITGTRNVFVDYPEYAWLLFSKEIPADMTTPSGEGRDGSSGSVTVPTEPTPCTHANTKLENQKDSTCDADGYTGDQVCTECGVITKTGSAIPAAHKDQDQDLHCDVCKVTLCTHPATALKDEKTANCTEEGYTGDKVCTDCGDVLEEGRILSKLEHQTVVVGQINATCGKDGYTGDTVCKDCNTPIAQGTVIPATGSHSYGQWVTVKKPTTKELGLQERSCTDCGHKESQELAMVEGSDKSLTMIAIAAVAVCGAGLVTMIVILSKKRKK